jgi:hypothetical protein
MTTIGVIMSKSNQNEPTSASEPSGAIPDQSGPADLNQSEAPATTAYWRLKQATANKLGKRAEGSIHYQIVTDINRLDLLISITGNDSGGYFSRELVPLPKVESCLAKCEAGKAFPSKSLKDAFVGLSSNNAGFLAAILRSEGLLGAALDAESKHITTGNVEAWKAALLAQPGTQIELPDTGTGKAATSAEPEPTTKKTLSLPRKKQQ